MTIDEIRKWLVENKDTEEVKKFFLDINPKKPLTAEEVSAFLGTDDGKTFIEPQIDKRVTDAVKKRDKYHDDRFETELKKRLAAEILKINPEEPPEQKQIRELRKQFEESEEARKTETLQNKISARAHEMGVDPLFVAGMNFQSEDEATVWMKRVIERDKTLKEKVTNELMATTSFKPGSGTGGPGGKPKTDLTKLSQDEMIKLEMQGKLDDMLHGQ